MPFGEYKDFSDCVAKNKGKVDDPEAYCATIKRKIEGEHAKTISRLGAAWKKAKLEFAQHSATELEMGIEQEMKEHGMGREEAEKTVKDHLRERADYYSASKAAGLVKHSASSEEIINLYKKGGWTNTPVAIAEKLGIPIRQVEGAIEEFIRKNPKWRETQHSGTAQIPADQKKKIDKNLHAYKSKFAKWREYRKATHEDIADRTEREMLKAKKERGESLDYVLSLYKQAQHPRIRKLWAELEAMHAKHTLRHGKLPNVRTARHQIASPMKEYAEIEAPFMREGWFRTDGTPYYYPWEVIARDAKTFEGKEFFIDHEEENGLEMGIIEKVYPKVINGVQWLTALVKVPEKPFTQPLLDRIESKLIKDVSSTHDFEVEPDDPTKTVKRLTGRALSTVREGEVGGARIAKIQRHIKKAKHNKQLVKLAKAWKTGRGA